MEAIEIVSLVFAILAALLYLILILPYLIRAAKTKWGPYWTLFIFVFFRLCDWGLEIGDILTDELAFKKSSNVALALAYCFFYISLWEINRRWLIALHHPNPLNVVENAILKYLSKIIIGLATFLQIISAIVAEDISWVASIVLSRIASIAMSFVMGVNILLILGIKVAYGSQAHWKIFSMLAVCAVLAILDATAKDIGSFIDSKYVEVVDIIKAVLSAVPEFIALIILLVFHIDQKVSEVPPPVVHNDAEMSTNNNIAMESNNQNNQSSPPPQSDDSAPRWVQMGMNYLVNRYNPANNTGGRTSRKERLAQLIVGTLIEGQQQQQQQPPQYNQGFVQQQQYGQPQNQQYPQPYQQQYGQPQNQQYSPPYQQQQYDHSQNQTSAPSYQQQMKEEPKNDHTPPPFQQQPQNQWNTQPYGYQPHDELKNEQNAQPYQQFNHQPKQQTVHPYQQEQYDRSNESPSQENAQPNHEAQYDRPNEFSNQENEQSSQQQEYDRPNEYTS